MGFFMEKYRYLQEEAGKGTLCQGADTSWQRVVPEGQRHFQLFDRECQ